MYSHMRYDFPFFLIKKQPKQW